MTSKRQPPPHKKLIVWQKAFTLGLEVYRVAKKLPASERFELGSQLRTACASITGNIAEGKGRRTKGEFAQFLGMARGSAREVDSHLEFAVGLGFLKDEDVDPALCLAGEVSRMLTGMMQKLTPM
jgi:four helix bundle protein